MILKDIGIIIKVTEYGDYDKLVFVLTKEKILKLFCPGTQKSKSKNRHCLNFSNEILFSYFASPYQDNFSKLKSCRIIKSNVNLFFNNDYAYKQINLITNFILYFFDSKKLPENIIAIIKAFTNDINLVINSKLLALFYLIKLILSNNELCFSACSCCSTKKNIAKISFSRGGFLCKKCSLIYDLKFDKLVFLSNFSQFIKVQNVNELNLDYYNNYSFVEYLVKNINEYYNSLGFKMILND